MNDTNAVEALVPPYIPFRAFKNFLVELHGNILPARIDASVLKATRVNTQYRPTLLRALRFLGFIDSASQPTEELTNLVSAIGIDDDKYGRILQTAIEHAYDFVFKDGFSLETATDSMLRERFLDSGVTGDTERKCIAFFLHAAKDAGMPISSHLSVKPRKARSKRQAPRAQSQIPTQTGSSGKKRSVGGKSSGAQSQDSLKNKLLDKFPDFNPQWDTEAQNNWFEAYQKLLSLTTENTED